MIEEQDYKFPHKEPKKPKPKTDLATLEYLEALDWRPHGIEW